MPNRKNIKLKKIMKGGTMNWRTGGADGDPDGDEYVPRDPAAVAAWEKRKLQLKKRAPTPSATTTRQNTHGGTSYSRGEGYPSRV